MHELTEKIKSVVKLYKSDYHAIDNIITKWATDQLRWLENDAMSLKRTREAFGMGAGRKILANKIRCKFCGEEIESKHRHDFVSCQCERVSVDGGKDYLKRCFQMADDYEELSTFA
jgi:hypothetical protein